MRNKIILTLLGILALLLAAPAAQASSDSPTPYLVTTEGVQLPAGDTFEANGHVNVRFYAPDDNVQRSAGLHFDPNNGHPGGQWIGKSFIPWSAFGIEDGSEIRWVQVHGYNEHFGEGGQKPIPVTPKPEADRETRTSTYVGAWEETALCETAEIRQERWSYLLTEERTQTVSWNPAAQSWNTTWGNWTVVSEEKVEKVEEQTLRMTDEQIAQLCGMPPTGAPLIGAAALAVGLLGGGIALAVRKRR